MIQHTTKQWQCNTEGLCANAQKKAEHTRERAEAAIALHIKEHRPITFKAVAQWESSLDLNQVSRCSENLPQVLADCVGDLIVRDTAHVASTRGSARQYLALL